MDFDFSELDSKLRANCPGAKPRHFFSPGRLEILGNHTDHNHGLVIVSPASLGISASVSERSDTLVDIESIGYGRFYFTLAELKQKDEEKFTPKALAKGVISALARLGRKVGGFSAVFQSSIFPGAGVSSSAAFELLVGEIVNDLYNGGNLSRLELARVGQYAENVYFGKPSGLLDQCGSSFGGLCFIDFEDVENPTVESLKWPFDDLKIVLVNPGLSHGKLTKYYASIPEDMASVAALFKKKYLREVEESEFYESIRMPDVELSETQKTRAIHFFEENDRVRRALKAIETGNEGMFLEIIRSTEISSAYLLRNAMVPGRYSKSPLEAVEKANAVLKNGASRLMGGGFAGTTINFLHEDEYPLFRKTMEAAYGEHSVVEVEIPPVGAHEVK